MSTAAMVCILAALAAGGGVPSALLALAAALGLVADMLTVKEKSP